MNFKMSEEAQIIKVYNFRADTNEFIGDGDAYISPHTGLPAYCTDIKPMDATSGNVAVFNSVDSVWSLVEDHRGKTVFDTGSGIKQEINELGPLPENTTYISPNGEYQKWDGEEWVTDEDAVIAANLAKNESEKNSRLQTTYNLITPLQYAVDVGEATDAEKERLISLKKYCVALNRVDCSNPVWPEEV